MMERLLHLRGPIDMHENLDGHLPHAIEDRLVRLGAASARV